MIKILAAITSVKTIISLTILTFAYGSTNSTNIDLTDKNAGSTIVYTPKDTATGINSGGSTGTKPGNWCINSTNSHTCAADRS